MVPRPYILLGKRRAPLRARFAPGGMHDSKATGPETMTNDSRHTDKQPQLPGRRPNVDKADSGKYDWDRDEMRERPGSPTPPRKKDGSAPWIHALREWAREFLGGFGCNNDDDATPSAA